MKKKKKKLYGMTLVEVIVAIAIFAIISALLASAAANVCSISRDTIKLNRRISNETPDAELKKAAEKSQSEMILTVDKKKYTVKGEKCVTSDDPENNYDDGGDFKYFEVLAEDAVVEGVLPKKEEGGE